MKLHPHIFIILLIGCFSCSLKQYPSFDANTIIDMIESDQTGKRNYEKRNQQLLLFEPEGPVIDYYDMALYMVQANENGLMKPKYSATEIKRETFQKHQFRLFIGDTPVPDEKTPEPRRSFVLVSFASPRYNPRTGAVDTLKSYTEGATVFLIGDMEKMPNDTTLFYANIKQRRIYNGRGGLFGKPPKIKTAKQKYNIDMAMRRNGNTVQIVHAVDRSLNKIGSEYNIYYNLLEMYGFKLLLKKKETGRKK